MAEDELDVVISAEISQPIPGEGAFSANDKVVLIRLKDSQKNIR